MKDKLAYELRLSDFKPLGCGIDEYNGRCAKERNSLENLKTFNKYDNRLFVLRVYNLGLMVGAIAVATKLGKLIFE